MMPKACNAPGAPITATLVLASPMARSTRGSVQLHGRPRSIWSRDIAAISAASARVARRTFMPARITPPSADNGDFTERDRAFPGRAVEHAVLSLGWRAQFRGGA